MEFISSIMGSIMIFIMGFASLWTPYLQYVLKLNNGHHYSIHSSAVYTPDEGDVLYEHADCEDPFAHAIQRIELDHVAIEVKSEAQDDTPRETDIQIIDEGIFKNESFNNKIAGMLKRCIEAAESDDEVNWIS